MKKWRQWLWKIPLFIVGLSVFGVVVFRFVPPVITPLILFRWVESQLAHKSVGIKINWRSLKSISPHLIRAVIASEDQRFFQHNGFDWEQIDRALDQYERGKRLRGASTISMQTARSIFLWQGRRGSISSWIRKGLEAYFTVLIEAIWSKRRILEVYLNVIEWGPGIYGAEAAARKYFKCPAKYLTPAQSALMVAVLPNPKRWSPTRPTPYILMRRDKILEQMSNISVPMHKL